MPFYQYACEECGSFESWTAMVHAAEPCLCPSCRSNSERQLATPNLGLMNGILRRAMDRSAKSVSEPRVSSRKHVDSCGCSLCAGRKAPASMSRRWMIGH
ncbi:FmdB family zinc ribbon protein [Acidiphilium iwatense]|uniref:FmdB family zinc ribbon protein n=1 Tax=Acidiphilium iwatense TaxID=768198 RepID=UPI0038B3BEBD